MDTIVHFHSLRVTLNLVQAVSEVIPKLSNKGIRMGRTANLDMVFHILIILVKNEDAALEETSMGSALSLMIQGGRGSCYYDILEWRIGPQRNT